MERNKGFYPLVFEGVCGLSVNFSEVSVIEYYRTLQLEADEKWKQVKYGGNQAIHITSMVTLRGFPYNTVMHCLGI